VSEPISVNRPSKGRSRYPYWTTGKGVKMRLEDMTDSHLKNTVAWMERKAREYYPKCLASGYSVLSMLQGEMAIMEVEREIEGLHEDGWEGILPLAYYDMLAELERRGLPLS